MVIFKCNKCGRRFGKEKPHGCDSGYTKDESRSLVNNLQAKVKKQFKKQDNGQKHRTRLQR